MPCNNFQSVAGADLRTTQYKAVAIAGTIAANNSAAFGIQQNKPNTGEDLTIAVAGVSRYRAGAAIAANAPVMVTTSGWLITCTSGSMACGKAIEAVTSGSIGEGYFNFAAAKTSPGA